MLTFQRVIRIKRPRMVSIELVDASALQHSAFLTEFLADGGNLQWIRSAGATPYLS